jgi:hypothetical protein
MIDEFPIACECRYTGQMVEFSTDICYFGEVSQVYADEAAMVPGKREIDAAGRKRSSTIASTTPIARWATS